MMDLTLDRPGLVDLLTDMSRKFGTPAILSSTTIALSVVALFIFSRDVHAQNQSQSITADEVFKYFGYVSVGISALAVATAAVFTTLRKSALTEWKELAESRKGKLAEMALDNERKDKRIAHLEALNEELEKMNFRLQDRKKGSENDA